MEWQVVSTNPPIFETQDHVIEAEEIIPNNSENICLTLHMVPRKSTFAYVYYPSQDPNPNETPAQIGLRERILTSVPVIESHPQTPINFHEFKQRTIENISRQLADTET